MANFPPIGGGYMSDTTINGVDPDAGTGGTGTPDSGTGEIPFYGFHFDPSPVEEGVNIFTGHSADECIAKRDAYFGANATELAEYDKDFFRVIGMKIVVPDEPYDRLTFMIRINQTWLDPFAVFDERWFGQTTSSAMLTDGEHLWSTINRLNEQVKDKGITVNGIPNIKYLNISGATVTRSKSTNNTLDLVMDKSAVTQALERVVKPLAKFGLFTTTTQRLELSISPTELPFRVIQDNTSNFETNKANGLIVSTTDTYSVTVDLGLTDISSDNGLATGIKLSIVEGDTTIVSKTTTDLSSEIDLQCKLEAGKIYRVVLTSNVNISCNINNKITWMVIDTSTTSHAKQLGRNLFLT